MTGPQAIDYIHGYNWLGSRPGLSRTRELLARMGHPERALKFIHIAGTNGKGSTAAMLASILQAAGYRTGLFTSPYLFRFHERVRVDGVQITDDALGEVTEAVRIHAETMVDHPTEFELVTCLAFEHFHRTHCDIVVLETGLGGRLDATNVINPPEVAVITAIGLDHTQQLGDTVEQIAAEKAGIIKEGGHVVLYRQEPSIMDVVTGACLRQHAPLTIADFDALESQEDTRHGQVIRWGGLEGLQLPLLGAHQRNNAAVALETLGVLRRRGWVIPEEAVRSGLARTVWPGRFEVLQENPFFIVDGGHNPQCAGTVAANLRSYFPGQQAVFLLGVLADKDYRGLVEQIAPLAAAFVAVTPDNSRALPAAELARYLATFGLPTEVCPTIPRGVAQTMLAADGLACALGSLYMTGAVRNCFGRT